MRMQRNLRKVPDPVPTGPEMEVPQEASDTIEPTSELVPENENDSDFEEPSAKGKGRGKRGAKKNEETPQAPKRARKGADKPPNTGGRGGRGRQEQENQENSLFEIVKTGKAALQTVVDDWIETYKQDRDTALLNLIQFFIQCSGCRGRITPQMYESLEHAELIRKMTEEFDEESGDYPLIMTGPLWKKFRSNFCEFVLVLIRQCQYSIIYDQYMMDNLISLLTGLTDSQVRAFRHTSTLASMKLMTALVDVALNLSINLDNTQRQYEAERQKNQSKKASERLEMLMTKRQELEENQEEIRNMLTYIFKGVFVHRYRDSQPDIRSICMQEIGVWMKKYANMFLDDSYLKYVGWTMYDKCGDVRLQCLKCLQPLFDSTDLSTKLELFTSRFKDRIVEMTLDKEYDVAVQAVKVVIAILQFSEGLLSDKDCENVYELVYSSHRQVAQAAGEFLNTKLFQIDEEAVKELRTKKGKKRSPNTPLVRDLVQFFIESELHEHGAYLVDSLWEINDMMKDWECMTDLLLEEPGRGEEIMDDRQEASLIEIMVCCVKQAATGESPVGRGPNRKLTMKENKQVGEDKTKLTEHFIVALPQLLAKYNADSEKVASLLQIPQHFDLEIYTTSRQEKHLDALLRHLQEVVEKHTDNQLLEACSLCYECLCNEEYAIAGKCHVARSSLVDGLKQKYDQAYMDYFEDEEADEDEAYALLASLKRLYAFYGCHDLSNWDLWDHLFSILKMGNENASIPHQIVCRALGCCALAIIWYLKQLDEHNPDKNEVKKVKKRQTDLMKMCYELMYHQHDRVNEEAFVTICDLLTVFSKQLGENAALMKPLVYEPDKALQNQLGTFLNEKVFVEDDDDEVDENVKIEELHNRRNFLASFSKLIVYNIISIRNAADMFKHYMKFYNDYGDIIKNTLSKSREISKISTAKTLAMSLTQLFQELPKAHAATVDRTTEGFQSLKELARRFALSFGLDQVKNREAVAAMHKEGIQFSLTPMENPEDPTGAPPNLAFLEILCEFTNKLMRQDKKTVVNYLDKLLSAGMPPGRSDDWTPLLTYRNSLVAGDEERASVTINQPGRPRGGRRPKRRFEGDDDSLSKQPRTPGARPPMPMTSTAIRGHGARELEDDEQSIQSSLAQESEHGSERDFEEQSMVSSMAGMSQVSWLNSQKRTRDMQRQQEMSYSRSLRTPSRPGLPEHQEDSISEFESPPPPY